MYPSLIYDIKDLFRSSISNELCHPKYYIIRLIKKQMNSRVFNYILWNLPFSTNGYLPLYYSPHSHFSCMSRIFSWKTKLLHLLDVLFDPLQAKTQLGNRYNLGCFCLYTVWRNCQSYACPAKDWLNRCVSLYFWIIPRKKRFLRRKIIWAIQCYVCHDKYPTS